MVKRKNLKIRNWLRLDRDSIHRFKILLVRPGEKLMHDLVSIVIPVYNSEKTIGRLISILRQQTYDKIEVIKD